MKYLKSTLGFILIALLCIAWKYGAGLESPSDYTLSDAEKAQIDLIVDDRRREGEARREKERQERVAAERITSDVLVYSKKYGRMVNPACPDEDMRGTIRRDIGYGCVYTPPEKQVKIIKQEKVVPQPPVLSYHEKWKRHYQQFAQEGADFTRLVDIGFKAIAGQEFTPSDQNFLNILQKRKYEEYDITLPMNIPAHIFHHVPLVEKGMAEGVALTLFLSLTGAFIGGVMGYVNHRNVGIGQVITMGWGIANSSFWKVFASFYAIYWAGLTYLMVIGTWGQAKQEKALQAAIGNGLIAMLIAYMVALLVFRPSLRVFSMCIAMPTFNAIKWKMATAGYAVAHDYYPKRWFRILISIYGFWLLALMLTNSFVFRNVLELSRFEGERFWLLALLPILLFLLSRVTFVWCKKGE